jgi:dynactin 1
MCTVKVEDCQRELVELKRSTRDSSQAAQGAEEKLQELAEQCELLTLDKEMAEERADALQLEVDTLKERVEELSLDLEVLQQEKEEDQLNVAHGEAPLLSSYSQLEKQNERLKEALIK